METPVPAESSSVATIPMNRLDWVWFYPAGTICNLACDHCLVGSHPHSKTLVPLTVDEFTRALDEVRKLQPGVPFNIGLTGGEVMILKSRKYERRLFPMVAKALEYGDVQMLTNALLADDKTLEALIEIDKAATHSLRFRVSLDGPTAEENDCLRTTESGTPTFDKIIAALRRFVALGLSPGIAYTYEGTGDGQAVLARQQLLEVRYRETLEREGLGSLELHGIPFFDQGSETERRDAGGIAHIESPHITDSCIKTYAANDHSRFQCSYSRSFGKENSGEIGWYRCAILSAREFDAGALFQGEDHSCFLDATLEKAAKPFCLDHEQCFTCFAAATQGSGMSCSS